MSYVPDPQTIRISFDSRAEAQAAYIEPDVNRIAVGALPYVRDATGTALSTNGGTVNWSPCKDYITPQHWAENTEPGVTDMTAALLAACEYASALRGDVNTMSHRIRVDLRGQDIGISETGIYGGVVLEGVDGIEITHGQLNAIGTWSGGDRAMIYIRNGVGSGNRARSVWLSNLSFEANRKAGCVTFDNTQFCGMTDCVGHGFISHGVRSITSNGAFALTRVFMREWLFSEIGEGAEDQANRVAVGFDIATADGTMTDCGASMCGVNFRRPGDGYNFKVMSFHPWNGYATVNEDPDTMYNMVLDDPKNLMLHNLYNDHGVIFINADNLHSANGDFLHLIGGLHSRSAAILGAGPRIIISTSVANNDLAGLMMIGHSFAIEAENIRFVTTGSGSFAANLRWTFLACEQWDGTPVTSNIGNLPHSIAGRLRIDSLGNLTVGRSGDATVQSDAALTLMGDYDNDADVSASQVRIGVNGTVYARMLNTGAMQFDRPVRLPTHTVGALPDAATYPEGMIYVSNESGGAVPAFSDGTNWRRVTDRAIVS